MPQPSPLTQVRNLPTPPSAWTQRASARTASGVMVSAINSHAICWCLTGGIERVCGSWTREANKANDLLREATKSECVTFWNDAPNRTHEEVLAALDRAIALEAAAEATEVTAPLLPKLQS